MKKSKKKAKKPVRAPKPPVLQVVRLKRVEEIRCARTDEIKVAWVLAAA